MSQDAEQSAGPSPVAERGARLRSIAMIAVFDIAGPLVAGTALGISKVMPFVFAATLGSWTGLYGAQQRRKGERLAAAEADASAPAGG